MLKPGVWQSKARNFPLFFLDEKSEMSLSHRGGGESMPVMMKGKGREREATAVALGEACSGLIGRNEAFSSNNHC